MKAPKVSCTEDVKNWWCQFPLICYTAKPNETTEEVHSYNSSRSSTLTSATAPQPQTIKQSPRKTGTPQNQTASTTVDLVFPNLDQIGRRKLRLSSESPLLQRDAPVILQWASKHRKSVSKTEEARALVTRPSSFERKKKRETRETRE